MYQKLQVGRATAMDELLSDTIDSVNLYDVRLSATASTSSGVSLGGGFTLIDFSAPFGSVEVGDLVYNTSSIPNVTTIITILNDSFVILKDNIGVTNGVPFRVLRRSTGPATLYIGTASASNTLKVRTAGGDDVVYNNVDAGGMLPVQVTRIYNTGTAGVSNLVALF